VRPRADDAAGEIAGRPGAGLFHHQGAAVERPLGVDVEPAAVDQGRSFDLFHIGPEIVLLPVIVIRGVVQPLLPVVDAAQTGFAVDVVERQV